MRRHALWSLLGMLACTPLSGAESDSGTTEATEGEVGSGSGSDSTGQAAETSTGEPSTGAADDSSDSTDTGGSTTAQGSETTASVDIECTWTMQPNTEREWGVCSPPQSWQDAEDYCVSVGGNLVSFAGATDNVFAINVLSGIMEAWIGLNDIGAPEVYEWSDGTPYVYMNWDDTQPDSEEHRCVGIGVTQRWFDFACDETRRFVCARPL